MWLLYTSLWVCQIFYSSTQSTTMLFIKEVKVNEGYWHSVFHDRIRDSTSITSYHITDGDTYLSAVGDKKLNVMHCEFIKYPKAISELSTDNNTTKVTVYKNEWHQLVKTCQDYTKYVDVFFRYAKHQQSPDNHNINKRRATRPPRPSTASPTYIPEGNKLGNVFIFNGTIWCGTGNKATSFRDLGIHKEVDECCRAHDYCKEFIPMFTTKFNYSNRLPFTISSCECDYDFFNCLKTANTKQAEEVMGLFFSTIGVPCFNIESGEVCADSSSFFFCSTYVKGASAKLNYVLSSLWSDIQKRIPLP